MKYLEHLAAHLQAVLGRFSIPKPSTQLATPIAFLKQIDDTYS
ncbi:MAG: hypothetical protein V3U88_10895 [Methylococcales bacterium]